MGSRRAAALTLAACLLVGCSGGTDPGPADDRASAGDASGAAAGSTPGPADTSTAPDGPPLTADLRQSSRDAAAGQVQVWLGNGTGAPLTPTRLTYRDGRLTREVLAERLREVPAGRELGFPVPLPPAACPVDGDAAGVLEVVWEGGREEVPVTDDNGTVAAYATSACQARRVARVARLAFLDEVPTTGQGTAATARLLLQVEPTGRVPGATLTLETVNGTPVLAPAGGLPFWAPRLPVGGLERTRVIQLPVAPARCDSHAFLEAGGATAFRLDVRLDEPGREPLFAELVVRMPPAGARAALDFALEACGLTG
ncbi:hypothetical protein [Nocardioides perillae]|uniref:Lipoprotein n=1 Tax=Nocardioides perillae TaxID=1119534 RepID=A0A7Y9RSY5_9ACTN|nr:hypothetical protein [Nocardioides perillae]NYG54098.1 hypothetical protein [Nocardioides perillae]